MMDPDLKARWVAALRSGNYKQGKSRLYDSANDAYCCLGVLCALQGLSTSEIVSLGEETDQLGFMQATYDTEAGEVVETYGQYSGLNEDKRYTLAALNDGDSREWPADKATPPKTFAEIADIIEQDKEI